jgi:uncharacterized protein involved in tolerance to divalent cations
MIIIQTTVDEQKKAKNLINLLLETNKIACGTYHEIQSSYNWKDQLFEDSEFEISLYTKDSLMREVVDIIRHRHSYELPKITVLEPVFTLPEYERWVTDSVN